MATNAARAPAPPSSVPSNVAGPASGPVRDDVSILTRFERAELAGAACTLGDLVRELRQPDTPHSKDDVVTLLDAYHRHLCSAWRSCPADGAAPVLAFSSFARSSRRD